METEIGLEGVLVTDVERSEGAAGSEDSREELAEKLRKEIREEIEVEMETKMSRIKQEFDRMNLVIAEMDEKLKEEKRRNISLESKYAKSQEYWRLESEKIRSERREEDEKMEERRLKLVERYIRRRIEMGKYLDDDDRDQDERRIREKVKEVSLNKLDELISSLERGNRGYSDVLRAGRMAITDCDFQIQSKIVDPKKSNIKSLIDNNYKHTGGFAKPIKGLLLTPDCRNLFCAKGRSKIGAKDISFEDLIEVVNKNRPAELGDARKTQNTVKIRDCFPIFEGTTKEELKNYLGKFHMHAIRAYSNDENRWFMELKERINKSGLGRLFQNLTTNNLNYVEYLEVIIDMIESDNPIKELDAKAKFASAKLEINELISDFAIRLKTLYRRIHPESEIQKDPILIEQFYGRIPSEISCEIERKSDNAVTITDVESDFNHIIKFTKAVEKEIGKDRVLELGKKYIKGRIGNQGADVHYEWRRKSSGSKSPTDYKAKYFDSIKGIGSNTNNSNVSGNEFVKKQSNNNFPFRRSSSGKCTGCKLNGHTLDKCWAKEITCYKCKEKGHYANNCVNTKKEDKPVVTKIVEPGEQGGKTS